MVNYSELRSTDQMLSHRRKKEKTALAAVVVAAVICVALLKLF